MRSGELCPHITSHGHEPVATIQFRDGTKDVTGAADVTGVTSLHGTPHGRPAGPLLPDCRLSFHHRPASRRTVTAAAVWEFQKQPQHGAVVVQSCKAYRKSSISSQCCLRKTTD